MKNIIQSVKGTREFYPLEMAIRNWLYENIRNVSKSFGYSEFDGPFLEPIDLYAAKSGSAGSRSKDETHTDKGADKGQEDIVL